MSLQTLQCALAELFTSVDARLRYDADSETFCRSYRLDERERAQLEALAGNAIASYAATLIAKRCSEAARLLPRTRAALGDEFARTFGAWANGSPLGEGPARYARDAAGFCKNLLRGGARTHAHAIKTDLASLRY